MARDRVRVCVTCGKPITRRGGQCKACHDAKLPRSPSLTLQVTLRDAETRAEQRRLFYLAREHRLL